MRVMGIHTTGPAVKKPHLIRNGKRIDCNISNYVPFVVPGLSASSSSTTPSSASSPSSSQDSVFDVNRYTETPVPERSGSTSEEPRETRMNPQKPKTQNKNEGREQVQSDLMHDLPDWLQEFKENLVDERSPSELRETLSLDIETLPVLLMNYQWSREQKWNQVRVSICLHALSEGPKLRFLFEDENNKGFLQRTR